MTTIDEIMAQAQRYAEAVVRDTDWASDQDDTDACNAALTDLCTLITQAIAEARVDGAREMRELCATVCDTTPPHPFRPSIEAAHAIRALPLPANREPVRLTDDDVDRIACGFTGAEDDLPSERIHAFANSIETAVLAANGMTT